MKKQSKKPARSPKKAPQKKKAAPSQAAKRHLVKKTVSKAAQKRSKRKASPAQAQKPALLPSYNHLKIEPKWQKFWEKNPGLSRAVDADAKRQKLFMLVEFPYPSGAGLHAGHVRSYTALDVIARKNRMQGKNVLYPIGWDAFGLPAENYAIKTGVQPRISTAANIKNFKRQMKSLAFSFDWSREVNTTDPAYFKWTQWIFLQFLKKGLAYRDKISINWCPKDKIGLANEEVIAGCCERCGTKVEKREKEQWMLAITKYADRLDKDLDDVNYLERIKIQQRNWIGKSEGVNLKCKVEGSDMWLEMYDSIPQTHAAQTFIVMAPDHASLPELIKDMPNKDEISAFAAQMVKDREAEGFDSDKEMKGIFTGRYVEYPATNSRLPIWLASFVIADYGTGVVSCSAHDERDFAFAKKYGIPLKAVLFPAPNSPENIARAERIRKFEEFYREPDGVLEEPAQFKGRRWDEVREDIIRYLVTNGWATTATQYKLRDWVFSRQRYWGEPIPVVHCAKCGIVPLLESQLPLVLPKVKKYEPTDNGESPLAAISSWVNTKCPSCKGAARRETDTMPNWAGSSWYYLRYMDPKNKKAFADPKKLKFWGQVDWYNGGMEHTTLHLLYSRFWHKFLFDQGLVPFSEPYAKRTSHGLIMADDGTKMSKSKGNVINPDDIIRTYGADTLRLFEMFIGPFDQAVAWNSDGLIGPRRFIERVFKLTSKFVKKGDISKESRSLLHKTIQKVGDDIEALSMNTAVSALMILSNQLEKEELIPKVEFEMFLALLAPFAPHVAEEMNAIIGNKKSVTLLPWPKANPAMIAEDNATITVQVNGKSRDFISISIADSRDEKNMVDMASKLDKVKVHLAGLTIRKTIFVPGKIVNFVAN